ncbi:hypothetical protein EVA_01755 [gut metagenome]|uniref:Uncharacterized protein n=1 Tax=gut metagenome TaxID=749906 RepID=J9GPJ5_9ZZZZ
MHLTHYTRILMLCVGFQYIRTFLHLCQGNHHILLLHTASP